VVGGIYVGSYWYVPSNRYNVGERNKLRSDRAVAVEFLAQYCCNTGPPIQQLRRTVFVNNRRTKQDARCSRVYSQY